MARLFGVQHPFLRTYFAKTEKDIAETILPYIPYVLMTETESTVRRDVLEYSRVTHKQDETDPQYGLNSRYFDESESEYISWNLSFDQAQTTGPIDELWGTPGRLESTAFFRRSSTLQLGKGSAQDDGTKNSGRKSWA